MQKTIVLDFFDKDSIGQNLLRFIDEFQPANPFLYNNVIENWDRTDLIFRNSFIRIFCDLLSTPMKHYRATRRLYRYSTNEEFRGEDQAPKIYQLVVGDNGRSLSMESKNVALPEFLNNIPNVSFMKSDNRYNFIDRASFYENRQDIVTGKRLVLTNGANVELQEGWGGLNAAITEIGNEDKTLFFKNPTLIHNPSLSFIGNLSSIVEKDSQKIKPVYKTPKVQYPPGSVFFVGNSVASPSGLATITGVYHIKGIDWSLEDKSLELSIDNIIFTQRYYTAILEHFITENTGDVIYLAPIPGKLFQGGRGTLYGLFSAVFSVRERIEGKSFILGIPNPPELEPIPLELQFWYVLLWKLNGNTSTIRKDARVNLNIY